MKANDALKFSILVTWWNISYFWQLGNQQSFSKALNGLRSKLQTSPRKQAAVVAGLTSKYGYQFGWKKHKSVTNETKGKVEKFYYRMDTVYIMPEKGDEMTIWTEGGRKRVWKYSPTMYLKEAYALCLESCEEDDDKCSFSTFCNFCPKNVLLLDESPKQQCKCQIHENLFLKFHNH